MTRTTTPATIIGPSDHGRRMSLEEFDHAEYGRDTFTS